MNTQKNALLSLLTISLLAASPLARADEVDNAPASMCIAASGALQVRTDGQIENASTASAIAICPSARLSVNGSFTRDVSGVVWVVDRHPTQDVCCRVQSKNPGGANIYGTTVCSSGSSTSYQTLSLPEITDNYSWSHFFVRCSVPGTSSGAASRILTFRTTQN